MAAGVVPLAVSWFNLRNLWSVCLVCALALVLVILYCVFIVVHCGFGCWLGSLGFCVEASV